MEARTSSSTFFRSTDTYTGLRDFLKDLPKAADAAMIADILAECVSASRHVLAREYYKALMSARKIVEYEERVLNVASGLHSGDSEG